ncbi:MAG: sulfatase [Halobacteriales archaeon]
MSPTTGTRSGSRPNVLFVVADQHRHDWLGAGDAPVRTPTLDRLTGEGVAFENAVCPAPVCNPARACLATGMEYDRCGVPSNRADLRPDRASLYHRLRDEAGYHVMACGKSDLRWPYGHGPGGDELAAAYGFSETVFTPAKGETSLRQMDGPDPADPYTRFLDGRGLLEEYVDHHRARRESDEPTYQTPLPEDAYYDAFIGRTGRDLIAEAPGDRPWFLQVNFQDPHGPMQVTETMSGWYRDPDAEVPDPTDPDEDADPAVTREWRRNYAAMVEHLDRQLGSFLDLLEERGEREETLIVFCGDHGEMLGDHGLWGKDVPYQPSVGVPFVVAGPGVESRGRVADPATILDLHATFHDLAGLDPHVETDSRSMAPYLTGEGAAPRDVVYSGLGPWRMAFDGQHKLILGFDEAEFRRDDLDQRLWRGLHGEVGRWWQSEREPILYDLADDPGERQNLAGERPGTVDRLRGDLRRIRDR